VALPPRILHLCPRQCPNKFAIALALRTLPGMNPGLDRLRLGNAQINLSLRSPCAIFAAL